MRAENALARGDFPPEQEHDEAFYDLALLASGGDEDAAQKALYDRVRARLDRRE